MEGCTGTDHLRSEDIQNELVYEVILESSQIR
jgi:hypothetical protein